MTFIILLQNSPIYLFILSWIIVTVILESSQKFSIYNKYYSLITAIIITFFIGIRWEVGTDWEPYKELFDNLNLTWSSITNVYHFDFGYVLLNAIVKLFTNNYTVFLLIDSSIAIGLLYLLFNKIAFRPNIGWLLFYVNFMLSQFMGSNRRMIAMACILWMVYYIAVDKRIKSYFAGGLAFLFHRTAAINLFLYVIPRKLVPVKYIIITLIICFFIGISQLPAKFIEIIADSLSSYTHIPIVELLNFYSSYGDEHLKFGSGSLVLATTFAVIKRSLFLLFYIFILKKISPDRLTIFFFNVYLLGFALYLVLIGSIFQMLTAYWAFAEIILITRLFYFTNRNEKILFIGFLFIFGYFQMINAMNVYPELYVPYKTFLSR